MHCERPASTTEAARADEGLKLALGGGFDLLLLDLILPGGSGWEILRTLRAARSELPIIVLTACVPRINASTGWNWSRRLCRKALQSA